MPETTALILKPLAASRPLSDEDIRDAYVYLLGRALVIRQEHIDLEEPGIAYNVIKYNPLGSADFVNPNLDVAYLEGWIAVDDRTPVLLEVPEINGRYYTVQILDEWGEVIVNINERTFPSHPYGKFTLVKPGSPARIAEGSARIELHSRKAKMLARVELKNDREGAVKLQKQFRLTSLGNPAVAPTPPMPVFNNKDLIGVEIFDDSDAKLSSALDVSPIAAEMQQKVRAVAAYALSTQAANASTEKRLRENVIPQFLDYAVTKSAPSRNHWVGGSNEVGNYGRDYRLRTVVNLLGIWANTPDEALYFMASRDADERPLHGSNQYILHFPSDQLPSGVVNAYWSVILVDVQNYRVVPNSLNRFNFNSYSPLKREPDGSLKIVIAPKPVAGTSQSNWLPSPEGKSFSMTFRTYVPKEAVRQGKWSPPALKLDVENAVTSNAA